MKKFVFTIIAIARLCHEANREYCKAIGDDSQLSWEDAPFWQKISAVKGVLLHLYHYPYINPAMSHESWMAEKIKDEWVYGEVKDPVAKTHPCLVPYNDLPVEQKVKDMLFIQIVHAVVKALPEDMVQQNLVRTNPGEEPATYIREIEPTQELIDAVAASCPCNIPPKDASLDGEPIDVS